MESKWTVPSRKWMAARVTELAALATLVATSGVWSKEATIAAIGVVSAGAIAYLLPNEGDGERGLTLVEALVVLLLVLVILALVGVLR